MIFYYYTVHCPKIAKSFFCHFILQTEPQENISKYWKSYRLQGKHNNWLKINIFLYPIGHFPSLIALLLVLLETNIPSVLVSNTLGSNSLNFLTSFLLDIGEALIVKIKMHKIAHNIKKHFILTYRFAGFNNTEVWGRKQDNIYTTAYESYRFNHDFLLSIE